MDIFISWSGRRSNAVALALREWLPTVLDNHVNPFVSSEDVAKGTRGLDKIAHELQGANHGIIVITPENASQPWLNFEAGALGNSVTGAKVSPFLIGLDFAALEGPVRQFQTTDASNKDEVRKLVNSINADLDRPLGGGTLATLFDSHWNELETAVTAALASSPDTEPSTEDRSVENVIDEILTTVRGLRRDFDRLPKSRSQTPAQVVDEYADTPIWVTELFHIGGENEAPLRSAGKMSNGSYRGRVIDSVDGLTKRAQKAFSLMAAQHERTIVLTGPRLGTFTFGTNSDISFVAPAQEAITNDQVE